MTVDEIFAIKKRVNETLLKRNGEGDVSVFAGPDFDLPPIKQGDPITEEVGQKTIDLLLNIVGREEDREYYKELGTGTAQGNPIPPAFNINDVNRICDELDADVDDPLRDRYNEEGENFTTIRKPEVNHCNGSCTGLCAGSCISLCSGCLGCSAQSMPAIASGL